MERSPRTTARTSASTRCSTALAEGLRVVSVLLHPYMPDATTRLLEALGPGRDAARSSDAALRRASRAARRSASSPPLFPKVEPVEAA